jgi:hydrogenase maturation protease
MRRRTVVLGIGNTLLADEGVGVHVVERLRAESPDDGTVEFVDGGTLSFTLADIMAGTDQLIIIDAAELDSPPGSVSLFENEALDDYLGHGKRRSVHEVSLLDLLAITHLTSDLPVKRALIGIQPQSVDWGEFPTPEVAAAIPLACDMTRELIWEWQQ